METYKFINLDNGDILLEKIIIDNNKYTIINKNNGDILLQKNTFITDIKDIQKYNFTKSVITECLIDNNNFTKLKYCSILGEIYNIINDGTKIIINTKLNIKTIIKNDEGFKYLDNIGISVQRVDSNKCLLEIINQCIENKINIYLKIKLIDDILVNISIV
jgi:hypothetical protein